jgi:hypothetical protein
MLFSKGHLSFSRAPTIPVHLSSETFNLAKIYSFLSTHQLRISVEHVVGFY